MGEYDKFWANSALIAVKPHLLKHNFYFLLFQELSLKLIDNCTSVSAHSPFLEIWWSRGRVHAFGWDCLIFSHLGCKFNPCIAKNFYISNKVFSKKIHIETLSSLGSLRHHHELFVEIKLRWHMSIFCRSRKYCS